MNKINLRSILSHYSNKYCLPDIFEVVLKKMREHFFGIDYSIFDKTILYYSEVRGEQISREDALSRALNKAQHKQAWYKKDRKTIEDKMHFYLEVNIYPFRQPYIKRFGGFRWYRNLVNHVEHPSILEYGCGSAFLTEYLVEKFPTCLYTVADIPSVTLDFVKWKKAKYNYPYKILDIGIAKQGIPITDMYDLIICQDILEHTPNPLEIVTCFIEHLKTGGVLVVDFLDAPGGENLDEAVRERDSVKQLMKDNLIALKAIDEPNGNNGLYVKLSGSFLV